MQENRLKSVSVIVPVYNVEQYLIKCLHSLVSQSVPFDEIILVNDGSTDDSRKICIDFKNLYSNIILLEQSNQGQSVARNHGLEIASGEYIVFVDADDYVDHNLNLCIQRQFNHCNPDMMNFGVNYINEIGKEYDKYCINDVYLGAGVMSGIEYFQERFWNNYNVVVYLFAFKREFLKKNGILFPEGLFYEDNVFFVKAVLCAECIICIPNRLYMRRLRPDSTMSGELTEKKGLDYINIQQLLWEQINLYSEKEKYKQFFKCFLTRSIMLPFVFLDSIRQNMNIQRGFEKMVFRFVRDWLWIYEGIELDWNDIYALQFILPYLKDNYGMSTTLSDLLIKVLNGKLKNLGLEEPDKKIGIYGTGKHTEDFLKLYETYAGRICCKLFFVMTTKNLDIYHGREVHDCNNLPTDLDFIILSSSVYAEEMKNELVKNGIEMGKIKMLYNKNDVHDITQMTNLTNYRVLKS